MTTARVRPFMAVIAIVLTAAGGLAFSDETPPGRRVSGVSTTSVTTVTNPLYLAWAKYKPGASVVLDVKVATNTRSDCVPLQFTLKLVAIEADHATVRIDYGNRAEWSLPARVPADAFKRLNDREVVALGRTFECEVYDGTGGFGSYPAGWKPNADSHWTYCLSKGIPGGFVSFDGGRDDFFLRMGVSIPNYGGSVSSFSLGGQPSTAATQPATSRAATAPATRAAAVRPFTYEAWAGFKPGSAETLRCESPRAEDPKSQFDLIYAETDVTADAIHLRVGNRLTVDGAEQPNGDPYPYNVPATDDGRADPFKRTGTREVAAAGRTFHCDVYECKGEWGPCRNDAAFVICTNPGVPGGIIEMTVTFVDDPAKAEQVFRLAAYTVR